MSVELRPLTDEEFADWVPKMRERYGDDMIANAGMTVEKAREKAAVDTERLLPGGKPTPDQLVYAVVADGERVGELWLCERDGEMSHNLFVYEIRIDDEQRGKGYGKAAMLLAEEEARRRGLDRVSLNVFGGNDVARNLYRSLGYEENAVAMSKKL
jgi:ribosomal protein S18 acetylase RimI-like enzyme